MSSNGAILLNRLMPRRASFRGKQVLWLLASLHLIALSILLATESDFVAKAAFLLVWIVLNCFWLAFVRRPAVAALISLELVIALTLLSRFKYDKLWMTLDFVDVMIVDLSRHKGGLLGANLLSNFLIDLDPKRNTILLWPRPATDGAIDLRPKEEPPAAGPAILIDGGDTDITTGSQ